MIDLPFDLSFEAWLDHVFEHEVTEREWHWAMDAPAWDFRDAPQRAAEHLVRLFEEPQVLLDRYSLEQIGIGLDYLLSSGCSDYPFVFTDFGLPPQYLERFVRAAFRVYERIFVHHCAYPSRCHSKLDYICFMWYDTAASPYHALRAGLADAVFETLEQTLALPSLACQAAALHGLGEFAHDNRQSRVAAIIDAYLMRSPDIPPDLREYAKAARTGNVL